MLSIYINITSRRSFAVVFCMNDGGGGGFTGGFSSEWSSSRSIERTNSRIEWIDVSSDPYQLSVRYQVSVHGNIYTLSTVYSEYNIKTLLDWIQSMNRHATWNMDAIYAMVLFAFCVLHHVNNLISNIFQNGWLTLRHFTATARTATAIRQWTLTPYIHVYTWLAHCTHGRL